MKTNLLEAELRLFYGQFKKLFPKLNRITFEVHEYSNIPGVSINGFYHLDDDCKSYENLQDLITQLMRNKILHRKF